MLLSTGSKAASVDDEKRMLPSGNHRELHGLRLQVVSVYGAQVSALLLVHAASAKPHHRYVH